MRPKLVELLDLVEGLGGREAGQEDKQALHSVSEAIAGFKVVLGDEAFESRFCQDYDVFNFYYLNDFMNDSTKMSLAKIAKRVRRW